MLFPIEDKGVKEEASSRILLMSGKEPLKEEEDPQCCSLRIGEIGISLRMSFTGAHTCEDDPGGYQWPPTFSNWLKTTFWQF
jgi:hypothetical protein